MYRGISVDGPSLRVHQRGQHIALRAVNSFRFSLHNDKNFFSPEPISLSLAHNASAFIYGFRGMNIIIKQKAEREREGAGFIAAYSIQV